MSGRKRPGSRQIAILAPYTWLHRHHPKQTYQTEAVQSLSEVGRRIALQRAVAVQEAGIAFPADSAIGFNSRSISVTIGPNIKDTGQL